MLITTDEVQVWSANLAISDQEALLQASILSADESARASRFRFPLHKKRFIATRFALRNILGKYLNCPAEKIVFNYNAYHKPYLSFPLDLNLSFNLSHSHDLALFAFRLDYAVGIDIEKSQATINRGLVERYFSKTENRDFALLPVEQQANAFYYLWTKKEAFIKAIGRGFAIPLTSFSVSANTNAEKIFFENTLWHLHSLTHFADYAAALASNHSYQITSHTFLT